VYWLDALARRLARSADGRAARRADPAPATRPSERAQFGLTRRQTLQAIALGGVAGPLTAALASPAATSGCLVADATCVRRARSSYRARVRRCPSSRGAGGLFAELRCRVIANTALLAAVDECRQTSDALCPAGQVCTPAGLCQSAPTPARPPEQGGLCAGDLPTGESLTAARAELAAGATDVALSPGGCVRYAVVRDGANVVEERTTFAGQLVMRLATAGATTTLALDGDEDGFFERTGTLVRGSSPELSIELLDYSPVTRALVSRERRTRSSAVTHVTIEEDRGAGLQVQATYDTTPSQGSAGRAARAASIFGCGEELERQFDNRLARCIDRWPNCLAKRGRRDLQKAMYRMYPHVKWDCEDDDTDTANIATARDADEGEFKGDPTVVINLPKWNRRSEEEQINGVCHELMHYAGSGLHDPDTLRLPRAFEADPTYACTILCQGYGLANKCHCASCLRSDVCDPRCDGLPECNPDLGGMCRCDKNHTTYETYTRCVEECPSGLACAFAGCRGWDVRCRYASG
jgi:hypothetical protein